MRCEGRKLALIGLLVVACDYASAGIPPRSNQNDLGQTSTSGATAELNGTQIVKVDVQATGSQYSKWVTLRDIRLQAMTGQGPVLIFLSARSHSSSAPELVYGVRLISPKAGLNNLWQVRYMRDSKIQVGAFEIGALSRNPGSQICLPLNLTAVDTPGGGLHVYTMQVRYVGDQVDGQSGQIQIQNARLVATSM
jgi:hypothetical protein